MKNIYPFFKSSLTKFSLKEISKYLEVNENTVKRWIEKEDVPHSYYFDLCRLNSIEIDYSIYTEKEKDQFFTSKSTALYCYEKVLQILENYDVNVDSYNFIEPSAGDGSFYNILPENRKIGLDIEPKSSNIIKTDFLLWHTDTTNNICIGNPPFGLRGHLALKFINHASKFSDFVCFILPQLFDSNGKGSCKSRVKDLNLIHSESINSSFHYPDGKPVSVNVVFQIWAKHYKNYEPKISLDGIIKLYSLSDGGTPATTRNKKYLYSCDYYLSSTCFGKSNMKLYYNFEHLPQRKGYGIKILKDKPTLDVAIQTINWEDVAFISTNGAYNLRFDIIEKEIYKVIQGPKVQVSQSKTISVLSLLK
jgi:hypothetical protein